MFHVKKGSVSSASYVKGDMGLNYPSCLPSELEVRDYSGSGMQELYGDCSPMKSRFEKNTLCPSAHLFLLYFESFSGLNLATITTGKVAI